MVNLKVHLDKAKAKDDRLEKLGILTCFFLEDLDIALLKKRENALRPDSPFVVEEDEPF